MGHTKGKWSVMHSSAHSDYQTFEVAMNKPSFEEKEANAKLISAAPDMLEALISLRKWAISKGIDIDGKLIINADNAINKATKQ